jgi:hypothetical protein
MVKRRGGINYRLLMATVPVVNPLNLAPGIYIQCCTSVFNIIMLRNMLAHASSRIGMRTSFSFLGVAYDGISSVVFLQLEVEEQAPGHRKKL